MLSFLLVGAILWLAVRDRWQRARIGNHVMSAYCRWGLFLLNIKVRTQGNFSYHGAMLVSNHLSYLDILAISGTYRTCFVTSMEVKRTPLLGQVCQMGGCLFVDRKSKQNIHKEIEEITEALRHNLNVTIFPEATSTNGEQVLRFRRPLYNGAIDASRPVVPFCQNYRLVGEAPISVENRDLVCWYGDMDFAPHLWAFCGTGGATVDLIFSEPLQPKSFSNLDELVANSQLAVEKNFLPVNRARAELPARSLEEGINAFQSSSLPESSLS